MKKFIAGVVVILFLFSCKKDTPTITGKTGGYLATSLNGFEYIGEFEENDAPLYYEYPSPFHFDDYGDNDRILVMSQNTAANPPKRIKWYVLNYKNQQVTETLRSDDGFGPDWGNFMKFGFNHEDFSIQSWHTTGYYFYQLGKEKKETSYFITDGNKLGTKIVKNHLLRFISEVSVWPYNTKTQQNEKQFLLTGELSAMKAIDYFIDEANYETQVENSIYTGYFYPSNDGNWIGVSQGNKRLDTVLISKEPTYYYNQFLCNTYVEKVGNKLYLAFIKNKMNPNTEQDLSMYELTIGENILRPLFVNQDLPPDENYTIQAFRNAKLYFFPTANATDQTPYTINTKGEKSPFLLPTKRTDASQLNMVFSKKYLYLTLTNDAPKRLEFYKKNLFND